MELKEFIKTVLVDVCDAIHEAKGLVNESCIAPHTIDGKRVGGEQLISFEISVSASDSTTKEGKGEIKVLSLGVDAGAMIAKETQHVNKISFQVPVYYSAKFKNRT